MQLFHLRIRTMFIVCAIVAPLHAALAGPTLVEEIGWLPGDVDFAIGVRDMTKVRSTPLGKGAAGLVRTGILIGGASRSETLKAWRSLSERLGYTEDQAFDALLGKRFFYASRERGDGQSDWVMYSRTSVNTARRVRKKLDVAPREIRHDRVLMSLEGGAFRLGSLIEEDGAWLMLAPTDRDGLFDQIANRDDNPGWVSLGAAKSMGKIRTLGDGELALYLTLGEDDRPGWLGAVAKARGDSVSFALISDPGKPLPAIEPWSTSIFDELRDGALYAHIGRLPTGDEIHAQDHGKNPDSMWVGLRRVFEIPHQIIGKELRLILGRRLAIAAHAKPAGGLSVCAAVEASDVRAMATPGDAAMRAIVDSISGILDAREVAFEFVGRLPRAVRRISLKPNLEGGSLPPFGEEVSITWSFRDTPGEAPAGWWIVGTDAESFLRSAKALTGLGDAARDGQTAAWLSLIEVHPALIIKSFKSGGGLFPGHLRALESVESFWMRTWIADEFETDLVLGAGSIRISEPTNARRRHKRHGH